MRNCYLFSNFGDTDVRNGQVQKALALKKLLGSRFCAEFFPVDVSRRVANLLKIFTRFRPDSIFCVSLGKNGIRVFALLYLLAASLLGKRRAPQLFYFVVGGWVYELARSSSLVQLFLRKTDAVFVETKSLASELSMLNVNAVVFPNFRSRLYENPKSMGTATIRLCFCSRIREDKGVLLAIDLVHLLLGGGKRVVLDFYGAIEPEFSDVFFSKLKEGVIQYKGFYHSEDEAIALMRQYDFIVLPTSYYGECMPGAVVEAFCAATPAITSDWRYMREIVDHGQNGLVIGLADFPRHAAAALMRVVDDGLYDRFSQKSLLKARSFYSELAAHDVLNAIPAFKS